MPTHIVFAGGDTLLVQEDAAAVVRGLEDISPNAADLLKVTRMDGHPDAGDIEGTPVYVRPSHVLYVAPA
jgi:hypothetical protein